MPFLFHVVVHACSSLRTSYVIIKLAFAFAIDIVAEPSVTTRLDTYSHSGALFS